MASDRNISVTLRANNLMAKGMADAKATIKSFGNTVRTVSRGLIGPIAGVIAIFAAVRKAVDAWATMLRAGEEGAAKARVAALGETVRILERDYKRLTEEIKRRNTVLKNGQQDMDREIKASQELADAQRELAKQKALAAIDPGDAAGRKAIERDFELGDAAQDAARKIAALRKEQEDLAAQSKQRADDAANLAEQYKKQTEAAKIAAKASGDIANQARKQSTTFKASLDKGVAMESLSEQAKAASELVDKLKKAREQTLKDEREALEESARLSRQAGTVKEQIQAAEIAARATMMKEGNKDAVAEAEAHNKRMIEIERETAKERQDLLKEMARNEDQLAREIKQREIRDLREKMDRDEEARQKAKAIADMRLADLIEARRKESEIDKEREKDAAKAQRLEAAIKRGVRLDRKSQEFLEAFREQERAKAVEDAIRQENLAIKNIVDGRQDEKPLEELKGEIKLLRENREQLQGMDDLIKAVNNITDKNKQEADTKTLREIRDELADSHRMLRELIPLG